MIQFEPVKEPSINWRNLLALIYSAIGLAMMLGIVCGIAYVAILLVYGGPYTLGTEGHYIDGYWTSNSCEQAAIDIGVKSQGKVSAFCWDRRIK